MKPSEVKSVLRFYVFMKPKQRRVFFATATKHQLRALEDACLNLLKNPRGLKKGDLARVRKYKEQIRMLSSRYEAVKKKRKVLSQRGGFLSVLLPLLTTLASAFV
jgi:hypothetical protein